MNEPVKLLWLIPLLPLLAGAICSVLRQSRRRTAFALAVGALTGSTILSLWVLMNTSGEPRPEVVNFGWFTFGTQELQLGFVLNPLTAVMVAMVSFVSLLIFIYSHGYMREDRNYSRFFCFLSLFAAGMLGLCVANSLLLLFVSWELVGLCSYLLIGFWYFKPSAAAAAKKAFIVTKLGDIGFFVGILWLYGLTGTQLLYDNGHGALEQTKFLATIQTSFFGMNMAGVLALLFFCGAVGKSGQFPLHVWLPDAMEGPTPVSALIHAATMVAAGVFMVGRMYPLFVAGPGSLKVVAWIGAFTALMAATIAVAHRDIKRILAYSTVSQLGYMMLALGVGGFAAAIFHLITHAFFKALLFLGAGSVIHGCHEEQDIFKMGGLRRAMPTTFWTYVVGAASLAGVPLLAGFWSKDAILGAAWHWQVSSGPFWMALLAAFLTAFYMTRQVSLVFLGKARSHDHPHESPKVMLAPLVILAFFAAVAGLIGTPWKNWFGHFLDPIGEAEEANVLFMLGASLVPLAGIAAGWLVYGKQPLKAGEADPLAKPLGLFYRALENRWYWDEIYEVTVVRLTWLMARAARTLDALLDMATILVAIVTQVLSWINQFIDDWMVNLGFDKLCGGVREGGRDFSKAQNGQIQNYLAVAALGATLLLGIYLMFLVNGSP